MVNEKIEKTIRKEYVEGNISHKTLFRLLGALYGDKPFTDHLTKDYDITLKDIQDARETLLNRRKNTNESISFGNTQERIAVYNLIQDESLFDIEVKHQIYQCQVTGNFFFETERETGEGTDEYEVSATGILGNGKNYLIKYDLITEDDLITFQILVKREDLLKRIQMLNCPVKTSNEQKRKSRGYTVPISQLLYDWDIDRQNAFNKEKRYKDNLLTK